MATPYDETGAMGGLFAPAFIFGDPVSEAAVARWNAAHLKKRPTADVASMIQPGAPTVLPGSVDVMRDRIASQLMSPDAGGTGLPGAAPDPDPGQDFGPGAAPSPAPGQNVDQYGNPSPNAQSLTQAANDPNAPAPAPAQTTSAPSPAPAAAAPAAAPAAAAPAAPAAPAAAAPPGTTPSFDTDFSLANAEGDSKQGSPLAAALAALASPGPNQATPSTTAPAQAAAPPGNPSHQGVTTMSDVVNGVQNAVSNIGHGIAGLLGGPSGQAAAPADQGPQGPETGVGFMGGSGDTAPSGIGPGVGAGATFGGGAPLGGGPDSFDMGQGYGGGDLSPGALGPGTGAGVGAADTPAGGNQAAVDAAMAGIGLSDSNDANPGGVAGAQSGDGTW